MALTLGTVLLLIVGFFATRMFGGVAGEYGKRLWFRFIEPLLLPVALQFVRWVRPRSETAVEAAEIVLQREHAELVSRIERLLRERDASMAETIRLRILLGRSLAESEKAKSSQKTAA